MCSSSSISKYPRVGGSLQVVLWKGCSFRQNVAYRESLRLLCFYDRCLRVVDSRIRQRNHPIPAESAMRVAGITILNHQKSENSLTTTVFNDDYGLQLPLYMNKISDVVCCQGELPHTVFTTPQHNTPQHNVPHLGVMWCNVANVLNPYTHPQLTCIFANYI